MSSVRKMKKNMMSSGFSYFSSKDEISIGIAKYLPGAKLSSKIRICSGLALDKYSGDSVGD